MTFTLVMYITDTSLAFYMPSLQLSMKLLTIIAKPSLVVTARTWWSMDNIIRLQVILEGEEAAVFTPVILHNLIFHGLLL
jgi:hypothetical protein